MLPLFFILGIIFAPLGGGLFYAGQKVQQLVIDYTDCQDLAKGSFTQIPTQYVKLNLNEVKGAPSPAAPQWKVTENEKKEPVCTLRFTIPSQVQAPVYMYYRLSNFYQNHRKYVRSFSEDQITGKTPSGNDVDGDDKCGSISKAPGDKVYYPCGLIANSLFNDTFSNLRSGDGKTKPYAMTDKGISWPTDRKRFKKTNYKASQIVPPPNWAKMYPDGYTNDNIPDLSQWEALMVWMRTAALPTFSKLAKRNDHDELGPGVYELDITSNFPIKSVRGTKSILLTQATAIGGRNIFLGIAYIAVGGIAILLGIVFLVRHLIRPRKLGDHRYLTWNTDDSNSSQTRDEFS